MEAWNRNESQLQEKAEQLHVCVPEFMVVKVFIYQVYMASPSVSFFTPQLDIRKLWTWDPFDAKNSDSNKMSSGAPILSTHLLLALTLFVFPREASEIWNGSQPAFWWLRNTFFKHFFQGHHPPAQAQRLLLTKPCFLTPLLPRDGDILRYERLLPRSQSKLWGKRSV